MKDLIKSITKSEWKFWAKVLVAVLILTSLSRILIIVMTPDDSVPRGNNIFSFGDRYVYISYIEQIRDGKYLFNDLYTSEKGLPPMLNIFWLGTGLFARFTGLSANAVLEFLRIFFTPFLLLVLYLLLAYFIKDIFQRKLAFLIASLGGGMGVVLLPVTQLIVALFSSLIEKVRILPIDLDVSEAFIFSSIYYSAHFIFSMVLLILIILLSLLAIEKKKAHYAIYTGVASLVLINFHPFTFFVAFFSFLTYLLFLFWKDRDSAWFLLKYSLLTGAIALPAAWYHFYMFDTPWWQSQTWETTTTRPFIFSIASGYGLLAVFAPYSLWLALKNRIEIKNEYFLLIWFLGGAVLPFFPTNVQGRFLEGYQIVLVILASYSLARFIQRKKRIFQGKIYCGILFITFFCLSYIFVIFLDIKNVLSRSNLIYVRKETSIALKELKKITKESDIILADISNANMIPGFAVRRVFVGHGVETIDYKRKYDTVREYMADTSSSERKVVLKQNKIDYVLYDSHWKSDWKWNPDEDKSLEKVYEYGAYKLYKVL